MKLQSSRQGSSGVRRDIEVSGREEKYQEQTCTWSFLTKIGSNSMRGRITSQGDFEVDIHFEKSEL